MVVDTETFLSFLAVVMSLESRQAFSMASVVMQEVQEINNPFTVSSDFYGGDYDSQRTPDPVLTELLGHIISIHAYNRKRFDSKIDVRPSTSKLLFLWSR